MSIGGQFTGLNMKELIGGPLGAAADASVQLAQSTADFINKVGFDDQKKVRTVNFGYSRKTENLDGTLNNDEMKVDVPILAIVPIPNLQVDEVNILFDMEVKESEKSESSLDGSGTFTSSVNFGIFKATVSGSVSTHSSNTRSSDNSAKYHVDVRAANHGTPEGLSRVLDMMAACIAPETLNSTVVDSDGKALEGKRKERAEKAKTIQAQLMTLNRKANAAKDSLGIAIERVRQMSQSKQNQYIMTLNNLLDKLNTDNLTEEQLKERDKISENIAKLNSGWNDFKNTLSGKVEVVQSYGTDSATRTQGLYKLVTLYSVNDAGELIAYTGDNDDGKSLYTIFENAINAQEKVNEMKKAVEDKQDEYNQIMYGG